MMRIFPFALLFAASLAAAEPIAIPAGAFQMGCSRGDTACAQDEGKPGGVKVFVPAFRIDRREVSVADYRACVAAGVCDMPLTHARNQYCNMDAAERNAHPVNCVDWAQARTYCQWQKGRLPWEAEWEKAARAGSSTRYPWGNQVSCKQAILDDGKTRGSAGDELDGCGEDRTWPGGSRAANAFGLFDMHGNAGEWTGNFYAPDAITRYYARGDLQAPAASPQKVVRGGSWDENADNLRSSFRNTKPPAQGDGIYGSIGFRCAYPAR
ncbi:MAG: formylglycine-generating enzyme family protein [Thiobacillus sp.]|nr:formylglycine-generating enzyme family protein [Thiobacillus sp.]